MKKISPFFSIISILLCIAGLAGAAVTVWLSIPLLRDGQVSKTAPAFILIFGLAAAVTSVIAGLSAYNQAKSIISLQRSVIQNKLDPRYSKTAKKAYRARLNFSQCRLRTILIVLFCMAAMVFACTAGLKIVQLLLLGVCGIVVPFVFLATAKSNS